MSEFLFDIPERINNNREILDKIGSRGKGKQVTRSVNTVFEKMAQIKEEVNRAFLAKKDRYGLITNKQDLSKYITQAIKSGSIAIDTETTSLSVMSAGLVGISLYYPGGIAVYIPISHISYITHEPIPEQISLVDLGEQLSRLSKIKIFMFNADFDISIVRKACNVLLPIYFDAYVSSRLLNENEPSNELKQLYSKYCTDGVEPVYSFASLFSGVDFRTVPIDSAYLYAANDAIITYDYAIFQMPYLTEGSPECEENELSGVSWVFWNIEMPLINVVNKMEYRGIRLDYEVNKKLSEKYHKELEEIEEQFYTLLHEEGIEKRYSISSPKQLGELLYLELKLPQINKKSPMTTEEKTISRLDHPIVKIILEYRSRAVLISTFIDKMPNTVDSKTGKIHCTYNQVGTDTGRFTSKNPNMQNIPSHTLDIRKQFIPTEGYVFLSADYSAQEPRITAHMCKDEKMIQAYKEGKDLYVEIASLAFNLPYEECMEYYSDGTANKAGKERRAQAKAIVLGICYSKEVPSIAKDLGISKIRAQEIHDKVMNAFPKLEEFMNDSQNMARELGYVTTMFGRKRRLPDMQIPEYEFEYTWENEDPFSYEVEEVPQKVRAKYLRALSQAWGYQKEKIISRAYEEGILIKDNSMLVAEATRKCVNSRIQGSAGDQIKIAMIKISKNRRLKELDFHLILQIHDELIAECPLENAKEASEIFKYEMENAIADTLSVPSICEIIIMDRWNGEKIVV